MKKSSVLGIFIILSISVFGQTEKNTRKIWRINFLNPAVELEKPTGRNSTFSSALGIGYGGGYPDLTSGGSGFVYIISPFLDLQQKWFYNLDNRKAKNKTTDNNSGNFISFRVISRGSSIEDNVNRTSDFDFAFGPTWGVQRKLKKHLHLLFDIGPQYYTDTNGRGNIWPLMVQLNLGFDLIK